MWVYTALYWYIWVFLIGCVGFLVLKKVLPRNIALADGGYLAGKTIGILLLSFISLHLGFLHLLPFSWFGLVAVLGGLVAFAIWTKPTLPTLTKNQWIIALTGEALFFVAFMFWVFVRGQEPNINSLEKFMDFGFMQSILRMDYPPPLDMWYGPGPENPLGSPINYYYFGHYWAAILIKLTGIIPTVGYNLVLATIVGLAVSQVFGIATTIVHLLHTHSQQNIKHFSLVPSIFVGIVAALLVNFAGNFHTLYLFTKGYENETPVPFWQIWTGKFTPESYWYPNATRFIPNTIHEFPSYSYVVADLHGHVLDIPFVLLTLLFIALMFFYPPRFALKKLGFKMQSIKEHVSSNKELYLWSGLFGFMAGVHYMTNAFDGPIYLALAMGAAFIMTRSVVVTTLFTVAMGASFVATTFFFTRHFEPFVSGIGVNCAVNGLVKLGKLGPLLFEADKCQLSAPYMLFVLWGGFFIAFIIFVWQLFLKHTIQPVAPLDSVLLLFFAFGTMLILIPEFFYIKDIYPTHFRANTMFKMGYQAYMMMGIAWAIVLYKARYVAHPGAKTLQIGILTASILLVMLYPQRAIHSFYGKLDKPVTLEGDKWISEKFPHDKEVIAYFNTQVKGQPVVLEAQGDSYSEYGRISVYTGLPTVGGWQVHEWLWRGSADIIGKRIPDIQAIYETKDKSEALRLLEKYRVDYVVVSDLEHIKYPNLHEEKFLEIGELVFRASNNKASVYKIKRQ